MKYLVVGAGGTGGCIGGFLAADGNDVTLIARGTQLTAIREHGLHLRGVNGGREALVTNIYACTAEEYAQRADVIFLCVKGYSVETVVPLLLRASDEKTLIVPILNGVGVGDRLASMLPGRTVLDGCMYIMSYISGPGEVTQSGKLFRVVLGERDGQTQKAAIARLAEKLEKSGINVVVSEHIRRDTFRKFMLVSPMAAAQAYYNCAAGELQKPGEPREFFCTLIRELEAIAGALRYEYPVDMVQDGLIKLDAVAPDATVSLQKDLQKGGDSEADEQIFEPVRLGRKLGVATPAYALVAARLGMK